MRKGPQIRKLPHVTLALALSMDELYTTCKHTQNVQFGTRKQNKPPNTPDKDKKKRRRRSPELPIPADADIRGWSNKKLLEPAVCIPSAMPKDTPTRARHPTYTSVDWTWYSSLVPNTRVPGTPGPGPRRTLCRVSGFVVDTVVEPNVLIRSAGFTHLHVHG
jgi:hypothetical protein